MKSWLVFVGCSQFIEIEDKWENDLRVKPGKGLVMTTLTISSLRLGRGPKEFNASITRGDTGCMYGQYDHLVQSILVINEARMSLTSGIANFLVLGLIYSVAGAMGAPD
jgi:hypothetical protein